MSAASLARNSRGCEGGGGLPLFLSLSLPHPVDSSMLGSNRYWEGVSKIKVMHSKWADARIQLLAFEC